MAGKDGIDGFGCHGGHIGHGADDVGGHAGINVQAEFSPVGGVEAARGSVFALGAAADVEKCFHESSMGRFFSKGTGNSMRLEKNPASL